MPCPWDLLGFRHAWPLRRRAESQLLVDVSAAALHSRNVKRPAEAFPIIVLLCTACAESKRM